MKECLPAELGAMVRAAEVPFQAIFELTNRCNLKCIHCYMEDSTVNELTTEEAISVVGQLAAAGTLRLVFTGGEALLRRDFFDIAECARRHGMALVLMSNGTLIDQSAAVELARLRFSSVSTSLYGSTAETHEAVTKVPGSFARTVDSIKLMRLNGIRVHVNVMVMKHNVNEIARIDDLCTRLGAEAKMDPYIGRTTAGSTAPLQYRVDDHDLREYMRWQAANEERQSHIYTDCDAGQAVVCVSAQGEVMPCIFLRLKAGNIRSQPFSSIWRGSPLLAWWRSATDADFKDCHGCDVRDHCFCCPGTALDETGDVFLRSKEMCRITRTRQEVTNESQRRRVESAQEVLEAGTYEV